jgi:hypothetical protein
MTFDLRNRFNEKEKNEEESNVSKQVSAAKQPNYFVTEPAMTFCMQ